MRLHAENYYDEVGPDHDENKTCAHYILSSIVTSFLGEEGAINPSWNKMYYKITSNPNRKFIFGGEDVHTIAKIDNYPYYPDPELHPELGKWNGLLNPLPCYKNEVNIKGNIQFVYNEKGWLVEESLTSSDYDQEEISAFFKLVKDE